MTNPPFRHKRRGLGRRAGFTMAELVVASSISVLVSTAVITTYVWTIRQATLCTKIAWSQNAAMHSSREVEEYLRNATDVLSYDVALGRWVQLRLADGTTATLVYSNAISQLRDGRLYLQTTNRSQLLVARGLTEIMDAQGFTAHVFTINARSNSVRVAYRVAEPTPAGTRAANDGPYAANVRFAACLRNAGD